MIGLNLTEFVDDARVIDWKATKPVERASSLLRVTLLDQISGCLWKDDHSTDENEGPSKLDCDWNTVGPRVIAVVR